MTTHFSFLKEAKSLLQLALPITFGNLSHILMGLIDNVMVGRLGKQALATISFSNAIFGFLIIVTVGMTAAMSPLVASAEGENQHKKCGEYLYHGLFLNLVFGSLILFVLAIITWNIHWFDQPQEILPLAKSYLTIVGPSLLLIVIFNSYRQFSEGLSLAKPMVFFLFLSLVINTVLNWLWIFGNGGFPKLGLVGAAWATTVARIVSTLALVVFIHRSFLFKKYLVKFKEIVWQKSQFKSYLSIGLPSSAQYCAEASAFTGAAIITGWVSLTALAAHQIALNLASMTFMLALGVSVAASVRVGKAFGQKKIEVARKTGFTAILTAAVVMTLCGFVFYFGREIFPKIYIEDPSVIRLAGSLLVIAAVFQFFDGAQAVGIGALRGLHDAKWPTGICVLAYWCLAIPLGYWLALPLNYGAIGVWIGLLVGLMISASLLAIRFHRLTRLSSQN